VRRAARGGHGERDDGGGCKERVQADGMMMGMCALREIRVPYIGYSCALYWVALLGTLIPRFEDIRQG
jgi:hypothetical protein